MNNKIKRILKGWIISLERYGNIDGLKLSHELNVLEEYLRSKKDKNSIRGLVKIIRDKVVSSFIDVEQTLSVLHQLFARIELQKQNEGSSETKKGNKWIHKHGQERRFKSETGHIFAERLKFKGGMYLRNFDVETESASESKKVRRIIEKRMCQAYHNMNRKHKRGEKEIPSNYDRYWEHRATAFQLYNIGQIENVRGVSRGNSTHWKRMRDHQTGMVVLKKKMSYPTKEAAQEAALKWHIKHPEDKRVIHVYQCAHCGKWHIGHNPAPTAESESSCSDIVIRNIREQQNQQSPRFRIKLKGQCHQVQNAILR